MTIENRSGSVAIRCDCPHCHMELIRRTREQVEEEASLAGWRFDVSSGEHLCLDCQRGNCPGAAVARARYGTDTLVVPAPEAVKKGAKVVAPDGTVLGTAATDAEKGEPLAVSLVAHPDPSKVMPRAGKPAGGEGFEIEDVVVLGGAPGGGKPS